MASREDCLRFFNQADLDNNGYLTLNELRAVLLREGYTDKQVKVFFKEADASGDGKITKDEFLTAMGHGSPEQHREAIMRRLFRSFDKNGDGTVDQEEMKNVFEELGKHLPDRQLQRMIELGDKDRSGALDYEEFIEQVFGIK